MDRNGVDMQVLSLTSPGIQVQPDPDITVADARTDNDFPADIIKEHPQRFAGLAAIPLPDSPRVSRREVPQGGAELAVAGRGSPPWCGAGTSAPQRRPCPGWTRPSWSG
jgi:2,3-dihydroxybenzoate decarboxylase